MLPRMTHATFIAWRVLLTLACLLLLATSIRLLIEERDAMHLFGIGASVAGAYYATRDLRT